MLESTESLESNIEIVVKWKTLSYHFRKKIAERNADLCVVCSKCEESQCLQEETPVVWIFTSF